MAVGVSLARWRDIRLPAAVEYLFPPDPGLVRLRDAARATLSAALTLLLTWLLGYVAGVALSTEVFGFAMSLLIAATVHDVTPRRERETMLLAIVPAIGAAALGIVLRPVPLIADAALVGILAAAIYAQAYAPRWPPLGTVAIISYVLTLVMHPALAELPLLLGVVAIAVLAAICVRFMLWPERPAATVRRIRRAIRRQIGSLLGMIDLAIRSGGWPPGLRHHLREGTARLTDAALLASAKLDPQARERGSALHLMELDLATERSVWVATHHMPEPAERSAVLARIAALRRTLAGEAVPIAPIESGSRLEPCLVTLARLLGDAPTVEMVVAGGALPAPSPPRPSAAKFRSTAQAAVATGLAVFGGHFISTTRWYWAAFAAFVVFQGTQSSDESLAKGMRFVLGTAAGVIGGTILASVLAGHPTLLLGGIVVAVFLAFNASTAAYAVMAFWVTIILALVFSLIGYFSPDLMVVRLEEGAFGVACGVTVAGVLWRVRGSDVAATARQGYLQALAVLTSAATQSLISGRPDAALEAAALTLEARFQTLRNVSRSGASFPSARDPLRRRMRLLTACEFWSRELGRIAREPGLRIDPDLTALMRRAAARIERTIEALSSAPMPSARLGDAPDGGIDEAADAQKTLASRPADQEPIKAAHLLLRIDAVLVRLARDRA
ncbi:MAG: FUSC family protein [Acetobacteraceae bacterium]